MAHPARHRRKRPKTPASGDPENGGRAKRPKTPASGDPENGGRAEWGQSILGQTLNLSGGNLHWQVNRFLKRVAEVLLPMSAMLGRVDKVPAPEAC